ERRVERDAHVVPRAVERPLDDAAVAIAGGETASVGRPAHGQHVARVPVPPEPHHAALARPGRDLPDADGAAAAAAGEPTAAGRELQRRRPAVDLAELLQRALGGEELTAAVARRTAGAGGVPQLHRVIAAALGDDLAEERVVAPRRRDHPPVVAREALREA